MFFHLGPFLVNTGLPFAKFIEKLLILSFVNHMHMLFSRHFSALCFRYRTAPSLPDINTAVSISLAILYLGLYVPLALPEKVSVRPGRTLSCFRCLRGLVRLWWLIPQPSSRPASDVTDVGIHQPKRTGKGC